MRLPKQKSLFFIFVILFSLNAVAQEPEELFLKYDISGSFVKVYAELKIPCCEPFVFNLPIDSREIESSEPFTQKKYPNHISLTFDNLNSFNNSSEIRISYLTQALIENNKNSFFILDLSKNPAQNTSLEVTLPKDATLKYSLDSSNPSIFPFTDKISTDGQRITLFWDESILNEKETVLVIYKINHFMKEALLIIIISTISIFFFAFILLRRFPKKTSRANTLATAQNASYEGKTPLVTSVQLDSPESNNNNTLSDNERYSELTKNLFEEEKQIILTLITSNTKELWQKEIQKQLGISKVKLSRRLRSLKQKGLIESIPYGNTNKIRLVTKTSSQ